MAPSEGSGRSAIKSLGLTVALALVPLLGARIPLPGVDSGAEWLRGAAGRSLSVLALGILPVLNGYFWVELAALVVPRWRWLRHDFPGGRAKLERAAGVLGLLLTGFQAFGLALMYEGVGEHDQGANVSRSLFVITLLGTTSVLLLLARVIDRLGLVCGALALQVALDLDSVVFYLQKRPLWASRSTPSSS